MKITNLFNINIKFDILKIHSTFTILDLTSKCRSKTELYNILVREGQINLPSSKRLHKDS